MRENIESYDANVGWAVVSGCDGEDVHLVAFFVRRERANHYLEYCLSRGADDDLRLSDGDAAVVPAIWNDGTLLLGNHWDDSEAARSLAEHVRKGGINYGDALERWLREAAPPSDKGSGT